MTLYLIHSNLVRDLHYPSLHNRALKRDCVRIKPIVWFRCKSPTASLSVFWSLVTPIHLNTSVSTSPVPTLFSFSSFNYTHYPHQLLHHHFHHMLPHSTATNYESQLLRIQQPERKIKYIELPIIDSQASHIYGATLIRTMQWLSRKPSRTHQKWHIPLLMIGTWTSVQWLS